MCAKYEEGQKGTALDTVYERKTATYGYILKAAVANVERKQLYQRPFCQKKPCQSEKSKDFQDNTFYSNVHFGQNFDILTRRRLSLSSQEKGDYFKQMRPALL